MVCGESEVVLSASPFALASTQIRIKRCLGLDIGSTALPKVGESVRQNPLKLPPAIHCYVPPALFPPLSHTWPNIGQLLD